MSITVAVPAPAEGRRNLAFILVRPDGSAQWTLIDMQDSEWRDHDSAELSRFYAEPALAYLQQAERGRLLARLAFRPDAFATATKGLPDEDDGA